LGKNGQSDQGRQGEEVMITKEIWKVSKKEPVMTPEELTKNSDKHGGLGSHMYQFIKMGIVTIPLVGPHGAAVGIPVSRESADRILKEGEILIEAEDYWSSITSSKVKKYFKDTREEIPMVTTFLTDPSAPPQNPKKIKNER
jgi:hypothetical protein